METGEELRLARRKLYDIPGFELLEDYAWDSVLSKWILKFRISGNFAPTEYVPQKTEWYCTLPSTYPWGDITIYPAAKNSISATFQHQNPNNYKEGALWRNGSICVSTSLGKWGKKFFNKEPFNTEQRLYWHINRCKDWIYAAATDSLVVDGDPFEMPAFPVSNTQLFVFNEDNSTFQQWQQLGIRYGAVYCKEAFRNAALSPIISFKSKQTELKYDWGKHITDSKGSEIAHIWALLNHAPVSYPWQLPLKWKELFDVTTSQSIDLKKILILEIFKPIKPKYLLLGFPIPNNIGEKNCSIFWLAIMLPKVAVIKNGFRPQSEELFKAQFAAMFKTDASITWVNSENWNAEEINSRGRIGRSMRNLRFTIIGAGAIGSNLAELLVRLGCYNLNIMDAELILIGNLSRHTLTMDKVHSEKAKSVAEKLNMIFPGGNVTSINKDLNYKLSQSDLDVLSEKTDVLIDATGDDATIQFISDFLSEKNKIFISLSTGFAAKRLFCFMKHTQEGNLATEFYKHLVPWLKRDADENPDPEFPREGIGCWHPIFPARIDDVLMLLSTTIQRIERFITNSETQAFVVIENDKNELGFTQGIKIIED